MALEVSCPSCEGRFRVPETAAGKKIRCPKCKGAIEVPAPEAAEQEPISFAPSPPPAPAPVPRPAPPAASKPKAPTRWAVGDDEETPSATPDPIPKSSKPAPPKLPPPSPKVKESAAPPATWLLKSEEGEEYGPVAREELDAWKKEGRITAECQLQLEGTGEWQWAAEVYPDMRVTEQQLEEEEPPAPLPARAPLKARGPAARKAVRPASDRETHDESRSSRSKAIAGLLGIFLGPLGTHRFYLGYWGIGLAMLFTGGGCGIWSLIDAVLVLLGRVTDADGRPLGD